jgi:hypothetical protein
MKKNGKKSRRSRVWRYVKGFLASVVLPGMAGILILGLCAVISESEGVEVDYYLAGRLPLSALTVDEKLAAWNKHIRLGGFCTAGYRRVLDELWAEEERLMVAGDKENVERLFAFEDAIRTSERYRAKKPWCSGRGRR